MHLILFNRTNYRSDAKILRVIYDRYDFARQSINDYQIQYIDEYAMFAKSERFSPKCYNKKAKTAKFQKEKYRKKLSRTKIFYAADQMGCLFGVVAILYPWT